MKPSEKKHAISCFGYLVFDNFLKFFILLHKPLKSGDFACRNNLTSSSLASIWMVVLVSNLPVISEIKREVKRSRTGVLDWSLNNSSISLILERSLSVHSSKASTTMYTLDKAEDRSCKASV